MGREFELKYRADAAVLRKIQEKYGNFVPILMETSYYDVPSRALEERRWMLRLRRENGVSLATLKTPLPDGSRGEWEAPAQSVDQALPLLLQQGAPQELEKLLAPGPVLTCAARFTRLARSLTVEGAVVELALDQGAFLAGEKQQSFAELEVELKQGREDCAAAFAQALAEEYRLSPEPLSKVQRATALSKSILK